MDAGAPAFDPDAAEFVPEGFDFAAPAPAAPAAAPAPAPAAGGLFAASMAGKSVKKDPFEERLAAMAAGFDAAKPAKAAAAPSKAPAGGLFAASMAGKSVKADPIAAQLAAKAAAFEAPKAASPKAAAAPAPAAAPKAATKPATKAAPATSGSGAAAASSGAGGAASASSSAAVMASVSRVGSLSKADVDEKLKEHDPRDHVNVVFMGHVDAGKSTLSGNILFLTGMVDQRTIDKFSRDAKAKNRESWFLAYIMDTDEQEREKGKTVEVGRAHFETEARRFTVLDAPGHKSFVPNMIQGASQADIGVLVISARRGEFEAGFDKGGQTREHAQLAKTLGVKELIVVVNKMDDPTVGWDKARFDEIQSALAPFLKKAGFSKKRVSYLPISGLKGINVKEGLREGVADWFTGPTLLSALDDVKIPGRDPYGALRFPIVDSFNDRGTTAMGKVEAGLVFEGQAVVLMPLGVAATIDKLFLDDETEITVAKPGENVRMRLKGVSDDDVKKGYVICEPHAPVHGVTKFQAQLMISNLDHKGIFTAGYRAIMHVHTADEEVVCERVLVELNPKTGEPKGRAKFVRDGALCSCILSLSRRTCLEKYEDLQQLGRFTLRDEGRTIAVGKVTGLPKSEVATE